MQLFFLTVGLEVKLIAEAYECCETDMIVDPEFGASETRLLKWLYVCTYLAVAAGGLLRIHSGHMYSSNLQAC